MSRYKYLIFITIFMVMSANLVAKADTATEVEALNSIMMKKFNAGEISDMVGIYAQNAVMLPPSSEILSSSASIQAYWDNLREVGVSDYSMYLVEIKLEDDLVYTTSLWEARRIIQGGKDITMDGNISNVFEKQKNGSWKIKLQSWN